MDIAFGQSQIKNTVYAGSTNTTYQCRFNKKASSQISFLRENLVIQKDLQLEVFKNCFKKGLSKRK